MVDLRIQVLAAAHDRRSFDCGDPALNRYLAALASQDVKRRISNCFVALSDDGAIAGYYTFAAASLPLTDLSPAEAKRLPRYPLVPAALVGRLTIDGRFKGQRLGGLLVMDALRRCGRAELAIHALLVDAKNDAAAAFSLRLGFSRCASRPMSFYLPIASVPQFQKT